MSGTSTLYGNWYDNVGGITNWISEKWDFENVLIHRNKITDSNDTVNKYFYDNELKLVLGHNTRKSYKLGQEINVVVKKADIYKRQIDLTLVN